MPQRLHSVNTRLGAVYVGLLLLVAGMGLASLRGLGELNAASAEVRERWLETTRYLGDLNNYTSDYRAAEAARLLATDRSEVDASHRELDSLREAVAEAARGYERLPHETSERALYRSFLDRWNAYRELAERVVGLADAGRREEAVELYRRESKTVYDAASDALGKLTGRAVESARTAGEHVRASYITAMWLIGGSITFGALIVVAALVYLHRAVSRPLLELARTMRRLANGEMVPEILGTARLDEIGEMARAVVVFRENAIDLAQSQSGLEQQASMLAERLEDEQRLTALQRDFVSMASHEFRTPLTVIDAHAQRLVSLKDRIVPGDLEERALRIRGAVMRMTGLIDRLIDSSRLFEAGTGLYFHPAELDCIAILREVCQQQRELTPRAQIIETYPDNALPAWGDAKLLHQAFANLVSNAVKYSPEGSEITVSAVRASDTVIVSVQDHGVGVPAADQGRVFDRYYRGSNVIGIPGTGLGLFMVKSIVDVHSGSIVCDTVEGGGSTFTVTLPQRSSPA